MADRTEAEIQAILEAQAAKVVPEEKVDNSPGAQLARLRETREAEAEAQASADAAAVTADETAAEQRDRGFFERFLPSDIGNVLDAKRSAKVVEGIDPGAEQLERQKGAQTTDSQN